MEDEKRVRAWRNVTDTKKRSNEGTREESQGVNLLSREGNSQTGHMMRRIKYKIVYNIKEILLSLAPFPWIHPLSRHPSFHYKNRMEFNKAGHETRLNLKKTSTCPRIKGLQRKRRMK